MRKSPSSLKRLLLLLPIALLILFAVPQQSQAQSKSFYWENFNVDIALLENGDMRIVETQTLNFSGGTFSYGYGTIYTGQKGSNDGITDISVSSNGVQYTESNSRSSNTFSVEESGDDVTITWYFDPVMGSQTYTFAYTVKGGIFVDDNGDTLSWIAIPSDHPGRVAASTVRILLPEGIAPQQYTGTTDYLVEGLINGNTDGVSVGVEENGRLITYITSQSIMPGEELITKAQIPHNSLPIETPSWQTKQQIGDTVSLAVLVLSLCLGVIGPLLALALWYTMGRDPETGIVAPDYITEPPNDLPPALVGTLIDERADLHDILSTLIDLARRGYLTMAEANKKKSDHTFTRTDKPDGNLRPFERQFLAALFLGKEEQDLSDLRYKFSGKLPSLRKALYEELKEEGLFPQSPDTVRNRYGCLGVGTLLLGGTAFFFLPMLLGDLVSTAICPSIGIALTGAVLWYIAGHMPSKTHKGAQAAAMWGAFENYLKNIEKHQDLETAGDIFEKYLAYATVFGLERTWIRKFSRVPSTPIPHWYHPYGYYGMGRRGVGRSGGDGGASMPTLEGMSGGMTGGLSSMSDGLNRMLNSSSTIMKSVKPSSSSSSGSSFSGGFSGGGGFSSGGGSRGFG